MKGNEKKEDHKYSVVSKRFCFGSMPLMIMIIDELGVGSRIHSIDYRFDQTQ